MKENKRSNHCWGIVNGRERKIVYSERERERERESVCVCVLER